mmetsp:Transcript_30027/g.63697  ORF Transcript_30027/g.63697 Transcript_30027/m.63697 type:complete len:437 (-) Transcript_30027:2712-4022(-)
MRLEVFAGLKESVSNAKQPDEAKAHHGRRKRSNWFILDASEKRFLKHGESSEGDHGSSKRKHQKEQQQNEHLTSSTVMSKEDSTAMSTPNPTDGEEDNNICKKVQRSKSGAAESTRGDHHGKKQLPGVKPQKWKEKEKKLFLDALDKHGNDWTLISEAVGTRTATQVKNYFFDNKKVIARHKEKIAKAAGKVDKATSSTQAGEPTTTTGKKKKKTKKAKKSAQQHAKSDVSTPTTKTTSESTKDVPSSVEGSTPGGSHPEKQILNSAESIPYVPPVATDGGGGISISSSSNNNNGIRGRRRPLPLLRLDLRPRRVERRAARADRSRSDSGRRRPDGNPAGARARSRLGRVRARRWTIGIIVCGRPAAATAATGTLLAVERAQDRDRTRAAARRGILGASLTNSGGSKSSGNSISSSSSNRVTARRTRRARGPARLP